ncbi:hypothetical protein [Alistipes indistinctus]|uniref:hypothetical protein n=1 Tax=Alistipes indistinctus TaxID=626932 RepID=UPI0024201CD7|nr:hypothetical protein [Alistipes indistinctus]
MARTVISCIVITCILSVTQWDAGTLLYGKPPHKQQKTLLQSIGQTQIRVDEEDLPKSFYKFSLNKFIDTYKKGVPEKLYLQLDKPYYCAGETIWFKGYLLNAVTLSYPRPTRFIYVELVDKRDSVRRRIKVIENWNGFHNNLNLPRNLPSGHYLLRGYTQWMQNEDEAFFFKKVIPIVNPAPHAIADTLSDGSSPVKTLSSTEHPIATTDRQQTTAHTSETADNQDDFDIQFFPEGGHLLPLGAQVVAFKAIGTDGLSVEVTGKVFDSAGRFVTELASIHKGMGRFSLTPQYGQRYYAEVTAQNGTIRKVELPEVERSGCSLTVANWRRLLCYMSATPDLDPERLAIMILCRGKILASEEFRKNEWFKEIDTDYLLPGICHILVVDRVAKIPLAERLFFIRDKQPARVSVAASRKHIAARKEIALDITITNYRGVPAEGRFAVSVTDHDLVRQEPWEENIQSYLLMSSDLKGHIEDPAYYFKDNDPQTDYKLDLLMLTHGWTRFDIKKVLLDIYPEHPYPPEVTQKFTGTISGLSGKQVKDVSLVFSILRYNYSKRFHLKDSCRFSYTAIIPDSTVFMVQALNKKERMRGIQLTMDQDTFPAVRNAVPSCLYTTSNEVAAAMQSYADNYRQLTIPVKQEPTLPKLLAASAPPAVVRALTVPKERRFFGLNANTTTPEHLSAYNASTALDALKEGILPGVSLKYTTDANGKRHRYLDCLGKPIGLILIDSMPYAADNDGIELLNTLHVSMIESAGAIMAGDPQLKAYHLQGVSGLLLVRMKSGEALTQPIAPLPSMLMFAPFGFKQETEFYSPKYETAQQKNDPVPDLRTTLYWNPEIHASGTVSFYTGDRPAVYDVILEGVTKNNHICRYITTIDLRPE